MSTGLTSPFAPPPIKSGTRLTQHGDMTASRSLRGKCRARGIISHVCDCAVNLRFRRPE
ncbi:hypothetical protein ACLOJK_014077 [Asimina triloba]